MTLNLPTIPAEIFTANEAQSAATRQAEIELIKTLRQKYSPLAQHAGVIQIAHRAGGQDDEGADVYLNDGDGPVHGIPLDNTFGKSQHAVWSHGDFDGTRLYLTARGWVQIERDGPWSADSTQINWWACGADAAAELWYGDIPSGDQDEPSIGGRVTPISDGDVVDEYNIEMLVGELSKQLALMVEKVPERTDRGRKAQDFADQLRAALSNG
jgi:hypothetical protein